MKKIFLLSIVALQTNVYAQTQHFTTENNNIFSSTNGEKVVVSKNANTTSVSEQNNTLFYIENEPNKIVSFDIETQQHTDLVTLGMKSADGYEVKTMITNIALAPLGDAIYFSTKHDYNGAEIHTTWQYATENKQVEVLCDGTLQNLDANGNLDVTFRGLDPEGIYTQHAIFSPQTRKIIHMADREYE